MIEKGSIRYRSEAGWPKERSGGGWKISHNRCFRAREKEAKEFSNFFVVLVRSVAEEKPELAL